MIETLEPKHEIRTKNEIIAIALAQFGVDITNPTEVYKKAILLGEQEKMDLSNLAQEYESAPSQDYQNAA